MPKPSWLKLPAGGKLYGTGPAGRHGPLVQFGQTVDGAWFVDDGSGIKTVEASVGAGMLYDMAEFYPAGLTIHGEAKLRQLKVAGEKILAPPRRSEVW